MLPAMTEQKNNLPPAEEPLLDAAADWLVRLNESTATEADFEDWQRWLAADHQHAKAFQDIEATWRLSSRAAISPPSKVALAQDGYRPEESLLTWLGRHRRIRRTRWALATAAVVLISVSAGMWWSRQPSVIQTAIAEQRVVWLPDGSRVTVGPRTRMAYRFTASKRALTLHEGQAYFEVQKAPDRPFIVETRRGRIVAVGTAFSVDIMPDRLNVVVAQGTVRIETPPQFSKGNVPAPAAEVVVTAGRRYVSALSGSRVDALPASAAPVPWREGRLAYYGDPLSAVVSDLGRYVPDRIELADPELGELRYTGTVFPEDVADWIASLPEAFPVRVERRGHGWVILSRSVTHPPTVVTRR
jgi:transmembrane sensor